MRQASLKFLETLVNTPSPSGSEVCGQRVWLDYVGEFADETFSDAYGNAVAVLNKGGSPRLMIAAHADEIAMTVNYIDEHGYIYVRKVGGVDAAITKAQRVVIHAADGDVKGVVGNVAPHLPKQDKDRKVPEMHDLFIDIGAGSAKEAGKLVAIGDPIRPTPRNAMVVFELVLIVIVDPLLQTVSRKDSPRSDGGTARGCGCSARRWRWPGCPFGFPRRGHPSAWFRLCGSRSSGRAGSR